MPPSPHTKTLSHEEKASDLTSILSLLIEKIKLRGDQPHVSVDEQLELLNALSQFELGKFLIQHRGVNGFWTDYFLCFPWMPESEKQKLLQLELFLLGNAPIIIATQERFKVFLRENQKAVKNGACLASVPCGLLGELLYLDYANVDNIRLFGVDIDATSLIQAKKLASQKQLSAFIHLEQSDAWNLHYENKFDLISSNGLTIYESDDTRVIELFKIFHHALKPSGRLITSFLTPPPGLTKNSEWQMSYINQKALRLQKIIFSDILEVKFNCFRSTETTRMQLKEAGFKKIEFIYDAAHIFPTVIATK